MRQRDGRRSTPNSRRPAEAGSYLRLIDSCITQLKAQGPSVTRVKKKKKNLPERELLDRGSTAGQDHTKPGTIMQFSGEIIVLETG